MKKFFAPLIFAVCILSVNFCSAMYYDDDPNYVFIDVQGSGCYHSYYYLPSLEVQIYNPPYYQIAITEVTIGGKGIIPEEHRFKEIIWYNWDKKETFRTDFYGNWSKDDIVNDYHEYCKKSADILFRAAYGMSFYYPQEFSAGDI